jgi:hypothetical protein
METGKLVKVGKLTEFQSNAPLRTKDVECSFVNRPKEGNQFVVTAKSLTAENDFRVVATSPVVEIVSISEGEDGAVILFNTQNSTYELTITGSHEVQP